MLLGMRDRTAWRPASRWLFILTIILPTQARAQEPGQLIDDSDGLRIWQRQVGEGGQFAFRAEIVLSRPIDEVLAVLWTTKYRVRWLSDAAEHHMVKRIAADQQILYLRLQSPLPFVLDDRDLTFVASLHFDAKHARIHASFEHLELPEVPPVDGVVRLPALSGRWQLDALGPQQTRVTYSLQADPGGEVPLSVFNMLAHRLPANTLRGIAAEVGDPRYATSLDEIRYLFDWQGFPVAAGQAE
jgi:hypothetical protein